MSATCHYCGASAAQVLAQFSNWNECRYHCPCPGCVGLYLRYYEPTTPERLKRRMDAFLDVAPRLAAETRPERLPAWLTIPPNYTGEKSLIIAGGTGSGKTRAAWYAIQQSWVMFGRKFAPFTHAELSTKLAQGALINYGRGADELVARCVSAPTLFIDDLGNGNADARVIDRLWEIIDRRYKTGAPILATTQYSSDALGEKLGGIEKTAALMRRIKNDGLMLVDPAYLAEAQKKRSAAKKEVLA